MIENKLIITYRIKQNYKNVSIIIIIYYVEVYIIYNCKILQYLLIQPAKSCVSLDKRRKISLTNNLLNPKKFDYSL